MDSFKILHLTDVHNGVRSLPKDDIKIGLEKTLFGHNGYSDVKVLAITGDTYDEALDHSSEDAFIVTEVIEMILRWAKRNNVVILLLLGTPSHDAKQPKWFEIINTMSGIGATLYYFDKLGIHYIKEIDKTVLAVPDEVAKPRSRVDAMIKALMKEKKVDKVDIALTHGYFSFHFKNLPHKLDDAHDAKFFKSIVRVITLNGHVHQPSLEDDVLTGGSWARMRHGEEEKKGAHLITVREDNSYLVEFIVNQHLMEFKTVVVKGMDDVSTIAKVEKVVKNWQRGNLRLHYHRNDGIGNLLRYFQTTYPHIQFSTKVEKIELVTNEKLKDISVKMKGVSVGPDNIAELVSKHAREKGVPEERLSRAIETLKALEVN